MAMNARLLRPLATEFDPRRIAGLLAWYDASDLSTLAQNSDGTTAASAQSDPVGYLRDKGPNGHNMTQSDNNLRPLLQLNEQGGKSTLLFDGSNDRLINTTDFLNGREVSVVYVAKRLADTNVSAVISAGRLGAAAPEVAFESTLRNTFLTPNNRVRVLPAAAGSIVRRNGAASLDTGSSPTTYMIAAASLVGTINAGTAGSGVLLGGARESGGSISFFFSGLIGEVAIYSGRLSLVQLQSLERYLSKKWGIALT
jgi:hypothetical protein